MSDARFCRILLHLARSKANPEGSSRHGYDLVAPLDASGHLDLAAWKEARARCRVRRFWEGEPDQTGHLIHRSGGRGGAAIMRSRRGSSNLMPGQPFGVCT